MLTDTLQGIFCLEINAIKLTHFPFVDPTLSKNHMSLNMHREINTKHRSRREFYPSVIWSLPYLPSSLPSSLSTSFFPPPSFLLSFQSRELGSYSSLLGGRKWWNEFRERRKWWKRQMFNKLVFWVLLFCWMAYIFVFVLFLFNFRLYLKGHTGTAGKQSSLILHGADFSTKDADNDNCMCKCALMLTGGESCGAFL